MKEHPGIERFMSSSHQSTRPTFLLFVERPISLLLKLCSQLVKLSRWLVFELQPISCPQQTALSVATNGGITNHQTNHVRKRSNAHAQTAWHISCILFAPVKPYATTYIFTNSSNISNSLKDHEDQTSLFFGLTQTWNSLGLWQSCQDNDVAPCDVARNKVPKHWRQDSYRLCVLKLNVSGASIALNFNGPKRIESYKNQKSKIKYSYTWLQINPTLSTYPFWIVSKSLKFTHLTFHLKKHLNKYWNSQK